MLCISTRLLFIRIDQCLCMTIFYTNPNAAPFKIKNKGNKGKILHCITCFLLFVISLTFSSLWTSSNQPANQSQHYKFNCYWRFISLEGHKTTHHKVQHVYFIKKQYIWFIIKSVLFHKTHKCKKFIQLSGQMFGRWQRFENWLSFKNSIIFCNPFSLWSENPFSEDWDVWPIKEFVNLLL